jgi:hypothetical protein
MDQILEGNYPSSSEIITNDNDVVKINEEIALDSVPGPQSQNI